MGEGMSPSIYTPPSHLGRFEVENRLGKGAVGFVYQLRDPEDGKPYAAKILHPKFRTGTGRARFLTEARALQALSHPNVIKIVEVGDLGHTQYFVMEFAGGGTLEALAERLGGLRLRAALTTTAALLKGLEAVHEAGMVHRDVKPSNVLLTEDGRTKLVDFGLVRTWASEVTQVGANLGTLLYSSPEQRYDPRAVTPPSDLYSVGATLCMLLTGQRPPNLSMQGLDPDMLRPFDPRVRPILERAGAYEPDDRYQTATAMCADVMALRETLQATPDRLRR